MYNSHSLSRCNHDPFVFLAIARLFCTDRKVWGLSNIIPGTGIMECLGVYYSSPHSSDGMRCCRSDWPGLFFFVVVVFNRVLLANRVDFGLYVS